MTDNAHGTGGNGVVKWISVVLMMAGFLVGGIAFSMQTRQDVRLIEQRVDIKVGEIDQKLDKLDTRLQQLDVAIDKLYRLRGMPDRPDQKSSPSLRKQNYEGGQRTGSGGTDRLDAIKPPTSPTQRESGGSGTNP